ncbi:hypothetical protein E2562_034298 [Oryza meyeriana var. granulata]|uniref:Uncharacterized protein n=1 Tax=Oryza meyeriana var. granulata TaxID=110450 RepID=A0A6G1FF22_9ORYZ|nr:hypothetical protein E2562_034298 [Oryza meyeriana var. granulata]
MVENRIVGAHCEESKISLQCCLYGKEVEADHLAKEAHASRRAARRDRAPHRTPRAIAIPARLDRAAYALRHASPPYRTPAPMRCAERSPSPSTRFVAIAALAVSSRACTFASTVMPARTHATRVPATTSSEPRRLHRPVIPTPRRDKLRATPARAQPHLSQPPLHAKAAVGPPVQRRRRVSLLALDRWGVSASAAPWHHRRHLSPTPSPLPYSRL